MDYPDQTALALTSGAAIPQRVELLTENLAVAAILSDYGAFVERLSRSKIGTPNEPVFEATMTNLARMAENLDASRLCALSGRTPAANILTRSLYEGLINILLIGFQRGEIPRRMLHRNLRDVPGAGVISREEMAERFIGFGHWKSLAYFRECFASLEANPNEQDTVTMVIDNQEALDLAKQRALSAEQRFRFNPEHTLYWHPFGGVHHARYHLWPDGETPMFPASAIGATPRLWDRGFFFGYKYASQETHGSAVALQFEESFRAMHEVTDPTGRRFETSALVLSRMLFTWGLEATALAIGASEAWRACKTYDKPGQKFTLNLQ